MMTIGKSPILPCHHVVFFLLLVLQVTGQERPGTTGQYPDQRPSQMSAVVIGMFMFMFFLTLVACGICCKYRGTAPETSSDTEDGGVVRTRRTSRGLEKDVIQLFPSFLYSQVKGLKIGKGGVECAICLNEFEDEEKIRLMPPCNHVFHADCVDVWLSSRSTCPVCRASLSPKPGSNQSLLYPFIRPHDHNNQDLETGNSGRSVLESADIRLLDGLTRSNNNVAKRPPRSRSTGTSNWRIAELLFPRSHSTGHSLVPRGENLDRFTLHLPEEVRKQLSHMTSLPQARSSRQGYRSQSVGSERRGFRSLAPRTITLSFSFSFQNAYLQSTKGKEEKEIGEGSLVRLRPEMVQSLH